MGFSPVALAVVLVLVFVTLGAAAAGEGETQPIRYPCTLTLGCPHPCPFVWINVSDPGQSQIICYGPGPVTTAVAS